jgi:hypothetical protein
MNTTEKRYDVGNHLPEAYLAKLLDFAEFIIQKQCQREEITKHTIPLIELLGRSVGAIDEFLWQSRFNSGATS